jgi:aminoglycoside phosphotransferase (APT) family kinase protein
VKGRASAIVDLGDGRLLRSGGDPKREAHVMALAHAHGFPVPRVHEVRGDALVLERIDGPTMATDLRRRPWRLARHARTLAALHERLHAIAVDGGSLLHLDLHAKNVLLSPRGPVVIDWTNARGGDPALDVALTWLVLATSGGRAGRLLARAFEREVDANELRRGLADAAAFRLADRHVRDDERAAVRRVVDRRSSSPLRRPMKEA